jgi:hypothetical protein
MKVTRKKNGNIYIESKGILDMLATGLFVVSCGIFGLVSFYAFWILLEFLR